MFYNFSEIAENDSILHADICIVGAGCCWNYNGFAL